jgi:TonB family protein
VKHLVLGSLLVALLPITGCGCAGKRPVHSSRSNDGSERVDCPERPGQVVGILSKAAIIKVINERIGTVQMCVETYLKTEDPGRVTVRFTVETDGTVERAEIVESTFDNERFDRCIVFAAKSWRFPSPDCGGVVSITFPFSIAFPEE